MSGIKRCAECGAPLPTYWPKGLCASCAIDGALEFQDSVAASRESAADLAGGGVTEKSPTLSRDAAMGRTRFGDYDLIEEIARGGMGVVYKARQRGLDRLVAVKMILAGPLARKEFVQRFRTEASSAAILQHPSIVAIHDVGVHEGRHYFSMDYVEGQSLSQLVGQQPLSPAKAARYVAIIAEAIHYAHEHGILHRDLKPSNVLIDSNDQPRVTDFGLARKFDADSSLTITGQVLGSPNFMPPEQAGAKRGKVGRPSDVYALGGILYYLLTARPPFQADSLEHTIAQVLNAEPVSPRLLNPSIPRDLETITLKCLEKEPSRRYQTAKELADELRRVLRHEPIQARPIHAPEKLWRWCRRKPALASALGFAVAALVIGLAATCWQWRRAEQQRLVTQHHLYVANMNLVQAAWEANNVSRVRQLLEETATAPERGFEWYYWQRQMHPVVKTLRGHAEPVLAVACSPDGQQIGTGSADNTAKLWEAATGRLLLTIRGHNDLVRSVAFSPDGRRILTASWDRTARVWDTATGNLLLKLEVHTAEVFSAAFSSDGRRIVTGSRDKTAKVWDAISGNLVRTLDGHSGVVWSVAFSPDGERVVTGSWDRTARVWSVTSGKELVKFERHGEAVFSVAFSPDGKRIVSGSFDQTAKVWDAATGHELFSLQGHSASVVAVTFSPDGRRIATAGDDQTARVWDADGRGHGLLAVKRHGSRVSSVAFSPDGQRLVTGGGSLTFQPDGKLIVAGDGDKTAKIWNLTGHTEELTLQGHAKEVASVAFSLNGERIVSGSFDQTAKVWDAASGRELRTLTGHSNAVRAVAISPDGRRAITGSFDKTAKVWDAASGSLVRTLNEQSIRFLSIAFSPDGQRIVTSGQNDKAKVWDVASGRELLTLEGQCLWIWSAAFSPDGRRIITGNEQGKFDATVWDAKSGKILLGLKGHESGSWVFSAAFSLDGQRIVTGSSDETAKVWDATSGEMLLTLKGHSARVMSVNFSPDGRRIISGSQDGTARLWDAASGKELLILKGHSGWVFSAMFSPDGRRIATGSGDRTSKIWEAASAEQVARWCKEEQAAVAAAEKLPANPQ